MKRVSGKYFCYMALSSTMLTSVAYADEERTLILEEITVTATKQAKNLQDVGMSISALGDEALTMMGAQGFEDFATSIPNLSFGYGGAGDGRNARSFSLRGISGRNTTGFYINETPVPNRIDPRLIDVNRIEVLRGPQGSLYGASSMGGTVRIITNKPDSSQIEGLVDATISNTKEGGWNYKLEGVLNIPIADNKAALRIIGYLEDEDGVYDRVFPDPSNPGEMRRIENVDNKQIKGIQAALGFTPGEDLEIIAKASFQDTSSEGAPWSSELGNFDQIKIVDIPETLDEEWVHLTLNVNYQRPWGDFTFVSSYFKQNYIENEDITDVVGVLFGGLIFPSEINQSIEPRNWTQEARFASSLEGPFNFIMGAYYNKADQKSLSVSLPVGLDAAFAAFVGAPPGTEIFGTDLLFQGASTVNVKELAIFGEAYFDVTDDLKLTVGGRWFDVDIDVFAKDEGIAADLSGAVTLGSTSEQGFNPKILGRVA